MTNIWRKGPLTTNPYRETAFHAIGIGPDVTSKAEIAQRIEERKQAVRNVPGYYKVGDRPVTETDIASARQILFDPTRRILEELLVHKPEVPDVREIESVMARIPEPEWPKGIPPVRNAKCLGAIAEELVRKLVDDLPPVNPAPFPADLTLVPPFGLREDEDGDETKRRVMDR